MLYSSRMKMLLFLVLLHKLSAAEFCNPADRSALVAVKASFPDSNAFPSWNSDLACCKWHGVECSGAMNSVTELSVIRSNLSGAIPFALAGLKHLQVLWLYKLPNLVGEIPPAIGELTSLTYLVISWTNVSGPVPGFLANLKNLENLDLSFNRLSGSVPPFLATLRYLNILDISRNELVGSIPDSFAGFAANRREFSTLFLSHNRLSGELPGSLASMNISRLDISRNRFSGDGSMLFGAGKIADTMVISRNNFQFDLSTVSFPASLDTLDLSHNRIFGRIPGQITDAVRLQRLNVSYNRLCGEIPGGWKLIFRA